MVAEFIGIALFIGIVSGAYPAFVLSSFQPANGVKAGTGIDSRGVFLRRALVAIQFTVSIALITCTYLIFLQLRYTQTKQLGFNKEQVIVLPTMYNHNAFKNELLKNPDIISVAVTNALPGKGLPWAVPVSLIGGPLGELWNISAFFSDFDFAKTLQLNFVAGRDFSDKFGTDSNAFVINEAASRKFGFNSKDMIGHQVLFFGNMKGPIIGAVKDFNFESLHQRTDPAIIAPIQQGLDWYIAVRVAPHDVQSTLDFIKEKWHEFAPQTPFEFSFLSDDLNALYKTDDRLATVFGYFSSVGILIACLGVFGLGSILVGTSHKGDCGSKGSWCLCIQHRSTAVERIYGTCFFGECSGMAYIISCNK